MKIVTNLYLKFVVALIQKIVENLSEFCSTLIYNSFSLRARIVEGIKKSRFTQQKNRESKKSFSKLLNSGKCATSLKLSKNVSQLVLNFVDARAEFPVPLRQRIFLSRLARRIRHYHYRRARGLLIVSNWRCEARRDIGKRSLSRDPVRLNFAGNYITGVSYKSICVPANEGRKWRFLIGSATDHSHIVNRASERKPVLHSPDIPSSAIFQPPTKSHE